MTYVDNQNETSKTTRSPFWFTDEWKKGEDWQQVYRQTPAHKRFLYVRNDEMTDEDIYSLGAVGFCHEFISKGDKASTHIKYNEFIVCRSNLHTG